MASHFSSCSLATVRAALQLPHQTNHPFNLQQQSWLALNKISLRSRRKGLKVVRVSDGGDSYLGMWKKAVDRERKEIEFQKVIESSDRVEESEESVDQEVLERKSNEFKKILEVPKEERDRIQQMQVIDRAAAAIAAARAILKERNGEAGAVDGGLEASDIDGMKNESGGKIGVQQGGQSGSLFVSQSATSSKGTPGPDFWSWTPPTDNERSSDDEAITQTTRKPSPSPTNTNSVLERERHVDFLPIPFESKLSERNPYPPLPPLQSMMEVEKAEHSSSSLEATSLQEEHEIGVQFSANAEEAAHALDKVDESLSYGMNPDGSSWWKETGVEHRTDGVVCRWTLTRGVSADRAVEWENKFWEAASEFGYKELGSEKSGRDATGNVWREYWKESMWQDRGLVHMEKTADKWGKNGKGDEWQEQWWEQYNASGQSEKWAHKWCSIDPNTPLEAGHAHVWHERWGEKYDGHGGSMKYTDKWAERSEGDGWAKWGDKWDENFNLNSHGVKQGETWWEGKYGERWNRTWGEHHNGSGWVHKYGKSSSGEHWDTHIEQETWYERYPHYGFMHCFDNSVQLRQVQKPSETP